MNISELRLPILVFTVAVNSILAFLVYKNNPKNVTNRIFATLSMVTSLWLVDVYLSVTPAFISNSLLWVRLSIMLGAAQILLFFLLAHTLPSPTLQLKRKTLRILLLLLGCVMIISMSPFAFRDVSIDGSQVEALPGLGLAAFMVFAVTFSSSAVFVLLKKLAHAVTDAKHQYKYVVAGLVLMLGLLIATVLIPVAFFKSSRFVPLVPLYTIAFLGFTTFAIIRHRLFDIRAVIARSVAYLMMVTIFVALYTVSALVISTILFNDGSINLERHVTYIALALAFTPTVYWLKRFFDKVTNRLFFQDSYDTQAVLDQLSNQLVGNIELEKILQESKRVLVDNLKIVGCWFVLTEGGGKAERIFGEHEAKSSDMRKVVGQLKKHELPAIINRDKLPESLAGLQEELRHDDIAMVINMSTHAGHVGYLMMGDKKSGSPYSSQDRALLTIVADELALAIQNALHFEEIENFNVTLQGKVENATRQLRSTNEKLKAMDETKDEFISMASHQLRTPLTSVKGYVSMVLEGDAGKISRQQAKLLDQAFISSQRMVYLIADLLNVSRLKTGKFIIEAKPTNLADVVEGELAQLTETAQAKNLELKYTKPKNFPLLNLDETKTRQVIMNFADNAIYYTPSGGHIEVALMDKPDSVEFTVKDDGIGVPRHEQHQLFSKFFRAGNARKARPDGTGLGLFMAKKVVAAQGGAIIFHSEEGKGSTFGFSFPKQTLLAKQPATKQS